MITAGGEERGVPAETLRDLKPKHAAVKRQRPVEVGHLEVHMPDAHVGMNGRGIRHYGSCPSSWSLVSSSK